MERWSSQLGFVLASVGAAVGIGNVWRFPAVVGGNGGGAYLLPYLLAAFVVALPLFVLELGVGRALRTDVVSAFRSVGPRAGAFGWVVTAVVAVVLSYYLVLVGWILAFLLAALTGSNLTFAGLTAGYASLPYVVATALLTGAVVSKGVRAGIERMSRLAIPVVFLVLAGLAAYAATLDGFGAGVAFFLSPDLSVLDDPLLWAAAFGQTFFSLSVGQGVMLTYGGYLDSEADLLRSALAVTLADVAVAGLAGLVIFPVVFTFGLDVTLGTELAFSTLPAAFASMPGGRAVAVAFFGLLFLAGLTSAVSLLEVCVSTVRRHTRAERSRGRVSWALTGAIALLGAPSALSYTAADWRLGGVRVLDVVDESVGTVGLLLTALGIAVCFAWLQPAGRLRGQIGGGVTFYLARYVSPAVLCVVLATRALSGVGTSWARLPRPAAAPVFLPVVALAAGVLGWRLFARRQGG
jgi:NSS family neurotransmitter:Na+ symporter